MYPFNNSNQSNYPISHNQVYNDSTSSPYGHATMTMPTPDFNINASYLESIGNYGFQSQANNNIPIYPIQNNNLPQYHHLKTPYYSPTQSPLQQTTPIHSPLIQSPLNQSPLIQSPLNQSPLIQSPLNQSPLNQSPQMSPPQNHYTNTDSNPYNVAANVNQNVLPTYPQSNYYNNLISNNYEKPQSNHASNELNYQANKLIYSDYKQQYEGTVKASQNFNALDDASKLYKAMKGLGTDETILIDILCRRTNQERLVIASTYKTAFGKDLVKDIKSETSGNFCVLLSSLLLPNIEYQAHELKYAIVGAGTDETALIDVICTKTNSEINELKNVYKQLYHRDIEKDIRSDCSGYFKRILISILNANRSEAPADMNRAKQLANELYHAGEKRLGTDEVKFNQIFAVESLQQLKLTFEEYYKLTGHDIEKAIKSEMSGDVKHAFLAITQIAKYPPGYYAERLYRSMKGIGTDDRTLIRNMILRSEIDMKEIKIEFKNKYSKSLESFIKGDCSGDYKRGLLALAGDQYWK